MAKNKTTETNHSVDAFINAIPDEKKRTDCAELVELIGKLTGLEPKMWGNSMVGFGSYHYKYKSGHEGDAPLTGLAPRANAITMYLMYDFDQKEELLAKLGKCKTGVGCIYFKKLEDIDTSVLSQMITNSIAYLKRLYPS